MMGCECVLAKCGLEYNADNVRIYTFRAADSSALTKAALGHATDQGLNTKSRSIIAQHVLPFLHVELSQSLSFFCPKACVERCRVTALGSIQAGLPHPRGRHPPYHGRVSTGTVTSSLTQGWAANAFCVCGTDRKLRCSASCWETCATRRQRNPASRFLGIFSHHNRKPRRLTFPSTGCAREELRRSLGSSQL